MSENNLISKIISMAKRQNIGQAELAERAGIRPETLSRAKKNANIHLETLLDLARIVGLRVTLVPDHPVAEQIQDGTLFPS
ncbi:MAG: helix-turn-helix domain-containing protein [Gammaproteobacteria bacterium]|nr:helix-turn-helix domain-containing protein [Gammaproteobacteria bacterium]MDH5650962.1 helix-turn-helix domain-containing protein [Gammaproteobacteria bacterium]